jgi:ribosomal protein S18 acetylase RimI-like enzyme
MGVAEVINLNIVSYWHCNPEILKLISEVKHQCFNEEEGFSDEDMPDLVNNSQLKILAFDGTKLIGYALTRYAFGAGYLYSIAVIPSYQGKHVGNKMLQMQLTEMSDAGVRYVYAHCNLLNNASAGLLRSNDFEVIGYECDFYVKGQDAIQWKKRLAL